MWPRMHFLDLQQLDRWRNDCDVHLNYTIVRIMAIMGGVGVLVKATHAHSRMY